MSDELPLSAISSSSDLCEMYSQERESNYKYHQMKIYNEKEEKRKRNRIKGEEEKEKCSRVHTSSPCPLLPSHDSGVWRAPRMRAGPQSWIIHLQRRILNTEGEMQRKERERRSEELNETERGEVKTTEGDGSYIVGRSDESLQFVGG